MRLSVAALAVLLLSCCALAQSASAQKPITVPITLDHNRVVIDVYLTLPDGTAKRIRGWVDNGNPELSMSRRVATLLGLNVTCDDKECSAPPPAEITVGEMKISLAKI